jgi:hypothetical protein
MPPTLALASDTTSMGQHADTRQGTLHEGSTHKKVPVRVASAQRRLCTSRMSCSGPSLSGANS